MYDIILFVAVVADRWVESRKPTQQKNSVDRREKPADRNACKMIGWQTSSWQQLVSCQQYGDDFTYWTSHYCHADAIAHTSLCCFSMRFCAILVTWCRLILRFKTVRLHHVHPCSSSLLSLSLTLLPWTNRKIPSWGCPFVEHGRDSEFFAVFGPRYPSSNQYCFVSLRLTRSHPQFS